MHGSIWPVIIPTPPPIPRQLLGQVQPFRPGDRGVGQIKNNFSFTKNTVRMEGQILVPSCRELSYLRIYQGPRWGIVSSCLDQACIAETTHILAGVIISLSHQKGAIIRGRRLFQMLLNRSCVLNILFFFQIKSQNNQIKKTEHWHLKCSKFGLMISFLLSMPSASELWIYCHWSVLLNETPL